MWCPNIEVFHLVTAKGKTKFWKKNVLLCSALFSNPSYAILYIYEPEGKCCKDYDKWEIRNKTKGTILWYFMRDEVCLFFTLRFFFFFFLICYIYNYSLAITLWFLRSSFRTSSKFNVNIAYYNKPDTNYSLKDALFQEIRF